MGESRAYFEIDMEGYSLAFSADHFSEYAKASDAIIAHNIWRSTLEKYLKNSTRMTTNTLKTIGTDNQLGFLLAIADTLEPLKRFQVENNVLDEIYIEKLEERVGCKIRTSETIYNKCYKSCTELEQWLDLKVKQDANAYEVEIYIEK